MRRGGPWDLKAGLVAHADDGASYEAPFWDDIRFPLTRGKQGQSDKPDFDFTNFGLLFPQNDTAEVAYMARQFPHGWALGTDLYPHVHFVQTVADAPTWKISYRWYEHDADPSGAWTPLTATGLSYSYVAGSLLQRATFPAIDGSGITSLSSWFECKLWRDDNLVVGDVLAKEFDLHALFTSPGSRTEYVK